MSEVKYDLSDYDRGYADGKISGYWLGFASGIAIAVVALFLIGRYVPL